MRIALLNTEPLITEWFARDYPAVQVCTEANESFMEAEYMLLLSWYEIEGEFFQLLPLWEKYLRLRHNAKKLVLIGARPFAKGNNYLQIGNMPSNWENWGKSVVRVRQKPAFPDLVEKDLIYYIERILHSHGHRAFQKLLARVQTLLRPIERALQSGTQPSIIKTMPELSVLAEMMEELMAVWQARKVYFCLMPQYVGLRQFEAIYQKWIRLRDHQERIEPKLSLQIGQYIQKAIIEDVIRVYKMEKLA
ncbi:MAG: hypothetical protein AB8H47_27855 [Bacteroidia bacterium]